MKVNFFVAGFQQAFKDTTRLFTHKWWSNRYYNVKDFFWPWNMVKMPKLYRSYSDIDTRMEHAILQLLVEFFKKEQPFKNWDAKIEKFSWEQQYRLLEVRHGQEAIDASLDIIAKASEKYEIEDAEVEIFQAKKVYPVYLRLLKIAEAYDKLGPSWDDCFNDAYFAASSKEQTRIYEKAEVQSNSDLMFVVEHRKWLWT